LEKARTIRKGDKSTNLQVEVCILCILLVDMQLLCCYYATIDYYVVVDILPGIKKIMKGKP
jgi:hypothetical protein